MGTLVYGPAEAAQLGMLGPEPWTQKVRRPDRRRRTGEADAYWNLSSSDRRRLGRWLADAPNGVPIDEVADWLGTDSDGAWSWLVDQTTMRRRLAEVTGWRDFDPLEDADPMVPTQMVPSRQGRNAQRLGCRCGRSIRVFPSVLAAGAIVCGVCGSPFGQGEGP